MKLLPAFLGVLVVAGTLACRGSYSEKVDKPPSPRHGMVVAEHPLAAQVGIEILDKGGNAADAAVAVALALAVVLPDAGNLGGGGFAISVPAQGEPVAIDFRETAPSGLDPSLFVDESGSFVSRRSLEGPLASGVPGSPAGLWALKERCGSDRFTFAQLVRPAIRLAERGFPVDAWLARDLRQPQIRALLTADAESRDKFYPDGQPLKEGETLVQLDLAHTLERLAILGPAGFYSGEVAENMIEDLQRTPIPEVESADREEWSPITAEDLESYEVREMAPLRAWFRGVEIFTMPPPSSGGVALLQTLAILDGLPMESAPDGRGPSARTVHWWIEAMRRAFADRAEYLGDPAFVDVQTDLLLSPERIARQRVSIGEEAATDIGPEGLQVSAESGQTTHLCVLDREGNAVSLTTTLNGAYGSGNTVKRCGFLMNNEMDDFSIVQGTPNMFGLVGSEANALAPGKRPLSSMTPTVVRAGRQNTIVIGSPGGPRIITSVIEVLLRTLVHSQSIDDAVCAPRLHQQWRPPYTRFEAGWDPAILDFLRERGHDVRVEPETRFASVQAIHWPEGGSPLGISDPRRGGIAASQSGWRSRARVPGEWTPGDPPVPAGP